MNQGEILDIARKVTFKLGGPAPNPFDRKSFEYRFWQDGVRAGMQAVDELNQKETASDGKDDACPMTGLRFKFPGKGYPNPPIMNINEPASGGKEEDAPGRKEGEVLSTGHLDTSSSHTIWKYPLVSIKNYWEMPILAKILTVQMQDGKPVLWAKVCKDLPKEKRLFKLVMTGEEFEDTGIYIGTVQCNALVMHIFEERCCDIRQE